jgi:hypothetical protein
MSLSLSDDLDCLVNPLTKRILGGQKQQQLSGSKLEQHSGDLETMFSFKEFGFNWNKRF